MATRPIDNLRILLDGGTPAWIPFSLHVGGVSGFCPPVQRKLGKTTGADCPDDFFGTDYRLFSLESHFGGADPAALHDRVEPGTTFDQWGIGHWAGGTEGTVDHMYPPLAKATSVKDVEALPLPVVETDVDSSPVDACHAAGYPVFGYAGSIYEWSWWIRGMETFMMDLLSDPPLAEAIIDKVTRFTTRLAAASARAGIDVLCFYDDAGMQRGMQIAPDLWRQYIKPAWQRVLVTTRRQFPDVRFFLHCCGKIDRIVPDVIELGFHVLHPIQPECMSFEEIYGRYGKEIVPAATISSQKVFPFGSPDEIRREVRRLAAIAKTDRRCILMPSNVIQPETPWENVVAFAEEARALRDR